VWVAPKALNRPATQDLLNQLAFEGWTAVMERDGGKYWVLGRCETRVGASLNAVPIPAGGD